MKKANAHALEQLGLRFLPTKQLVSTMTIIWAHVSDILEKMPNKEASS